MNIKKVLLIHKKSAYKVYFLERNSSFYKKEHLFSKAELESFKIAHAKHYASLAQVEKILKNCGIVYHKRCRGQECHAQGCDLIITVGGDGTFLEAARAAKQQYLLGVNSDPERSFGRFCASNALRFEEDLHKILSGRFRVQQFQRIACHLELAKESRVIQVLNDILVCHQNPAAMSRYKLIIGRRQEEQRSSGLWVSTAAGSSGAIKSAGGKVLPKGSKEIEYRPREMFTGFKPRYNFSGGILNLEKPVKIESQMRSGMIYIDGAHFKFPFCFGEKVVLRKSKLPLRMIEV